MPGDVIVYINSPTLYIELPPVLTLGRGLPKGQREGQRERQREQTASLDCGHDTRDTQISKAQSMTSRNTQSLCETDTQRS